MFGHGSGHVPFVEVFKREDGLYDWHLIASNGEIVCGTQQGYTSQWDAKEGFNLTVALLGTKPEVRFKT